MSDRLEEIKNLCRYNGSFYKGITVTRKASEYVDWLISELEQSRAEVKRLKKQTIAERVARVVADADSRIEKAEAEVTRLTKVLAKALLAYQGTHY